VADPRVSILFPVFNGARYLRGALDSLLAQTMPDFEIEILNDGSTDDTGTILGSYRDPRIRCTEQANAGISASLNRLVERARGRYLARMDHDDWSRPDRLALQAAYLDEHPGTALVGSWAEVMDEDGRVVFLTRHPVTAAGIREAMLFTNPIAHGSVMMRRVPELEYRAAFDDAEDLELWERLARRHDLANLPQPLYRWRMNPEGISRLRRDRQSARARSVIDRHRAWYLARAAELAPSPAELAAERRAAGLAVVAKRKLRLLGLLVSHRAARAAVRSGADLLRLPFLR
jgi:glycosyltransferase involved in cell wall biosynthesis